MWFFPGSWGIVLPRCFTSAAVDTGELTGNAVQSSLRNRTNSVYRLRIFTVGPCVRQLDKRIRGELTFLSCSSISYT